MHAVLTIRGEIPFIKNEVKWKTKDYSHTIMELGKAVKYDMKFIARNLVLTAVTVGKT